MNADDDDFPDFLPIDLWADEAPRDVVPLVVMCAACGQDIHAASVGCVENPGYRWGDEPFGDVAPIYEGWIDPKLRPCRDCAAPAGAFHHPGCTVMRCRTCDDQLLFCDHCPEEW